MFKKIRKGRLKKIKFKINKLIFGNLGLKAVESGIINLKQIEATKQAISKKANRKAKIWVKIFSNLVITSKPMGVRMGKGKGIFSHWGAKITRGNILIEVCGTNKNVLLKALKIGKTKLPIKTKICN